MAEKPDRPFSMVNDGVKSTANYLELTDTSDSQNHSRYVQFDLGDEYDLMKIHMTRYWDGSRKIRTDSDPVKYRRELCGRQNDNGI